MTDLAIRVENLSKLYRIGAKQERYRTLRDTLTDAATAPLRRVSSFIRRAPRDGYTSRFTHHRTQSTADEWIWALKDVSFQVQRGEVVGIIGRNGAGKTTLLKILSRITEPTEGYAEIHGRVRSLLEVGTGFHPELTGRENIYLNGAILGMKRAEIEHKFDEIVAFAEIDKFLDTPVKHYSSGMYVRLAFAVAAHLEPEILLVDEVLAVGDAAFQKKCLGKMGDVAREGRTVLFVSHNMGAIQALCNRACWLSDGQLSMNGLATNVVNAYLSATNTDSKGLDIEHAPRVTGGRDIRLVRVELLDKQLHPTQLFSFGNTMILRFHARLLHRTFRAFAVEWYICTLTGERVVYGSSSPQQGLLFVPTDEHCCVECRLESVPLTSGTYRLDCLLSVPHQERLDEVENVAAFQVAACDVYGTGFSLTNRNGLTGIRNSWSIVCGAQSLLPS